MKSIGGYFSLELQTGDHYHKNAIMLNTARNCLEYVLLSKQYKKIYIPYYTCEAIVEPLVRQNIDYEFYHINELLEPVETYELCADELFLYTNYFGIKNEVVKRLSELYGKQFIADNAQAFFTRPLEGVDTFYSPRKFFGVADGGYLFTDKILNETFKQDISFDRMSHLLKRIENSAEYAYADFQKNEGSLINEPIKKMSNLTESILPGIDYETARKKRLENFRILHSALKNNNLLQCDFSFDDMVPMVYPFWGEDETLRKKLINNKVYAATYWPNVFDWCNEEDLEYVLAKNIIPLPIDQRYDEKDMQHIIKIIV